MSLQLKSLLSRAALSLLALASAGCSAGPRFSSWSFGITADAPKKCFTNISYDWPDLGVITAFGKQPGKTCGMGAGYTGSNIRPTSPLVIKWTNSEGRKKWAKLDISRFLSTTAFEGGWVTVRLSENKATVFLDEEINRVSISPILAKKVLEVEASE